MGAIGAFSISLQHGGDGVAGFGFAGFVDGDDAEFEAGALGEAGEGGFGVEGHAFEFPGGGAGAVGELAALDGVALGLATGLGGGLFPVERDGAGAFALGVEDIGFSAGEGGHADSWCGFLTVVKAFSLVDHLKMPDSRAGALGEALS